jgi:hypothetical protein
MLRRLKRNIARVNMELAGIVKRNRRQGMRNRRNRVQVLFSNFPTKKETSDRSFFAANWRKHLGFIDYAAIFARKARKERRGA